MIDRYINRQHLQEYIDIFPQEKMMKLWQEFLSSSAESWKNLSKMRPEQMRLVFHSWKSNSQVFGMDAFARQCAVLEEKLLKRQTVDSLSTDIENCLYCYKLSVDEVKRCFFNQMNGCENV